MYPFSREQEVAALVQEVHDLLPNVPPDQEKPLAFAVFTVVRRHGYVGLRRDLADSVAFDVLFHAYQIAHPGPAMTLREALAAGGAADHPRKDGTYFRVTPRYNGWMLGTILFPEWRAQGHRGAYEDWFTSIKRVEEVLAETYPDYNPQGWHPIAWERGA